MTDEGLPDELRDLGRHLRVPDVDGETMAERVLAQLLAEQVPAPAAPRRRFGRLGFGWLRGRWKALLAALSGVLVVLVLTPPVRATVADWFGFGGVEVRYDPGTHPGPGAAVPECTDPVSLEEAGRRAGFTPLIPSTLGPPDAVSVTGSAEPGRAVITLCWRQDGSRTVRLDEFPARLPMAFGKQVQTHPEWVDLPDGAEGYWFAEPHLLRFPMTDASGKEWTQSIRTAGPTLLWTRNAGALTLRLEGEPSLEKARRIAESAG